MRAKMIRLLLSGALVLPVCLTGVVTAFQLQESRDSSDAVARPRLSRAAVDDVFSVAAEQADQATPVVPAPRPNPAGLTAPDVKTEATKTDESTRPGAVIAPPAPGSAADVQQEAAGKESLHDQKANRAYFVRLTVDGLLPGRLQYVDGRSRGLVPAKRVSISFVQHGKVVSQARPGVDGFFQAAGLVPGFYTVVASGPDGILTFGVEVFPALTMSARNSDSERRTKENVRMDIDTERFSLRQTESENMRDSESFLRIDAILVPPRDIPVVRRILEVYVTSPRPMPSNRDMSPRAALKNAEQTIQLVKAQKAQFANDQATIRAVQNSPQKTVQGSWGSPLRSPVFYKYENGLVGGRLTRFVPDVVNNDVHFRAPLVSASVYFVRNGAVVEQATTDQQGQFRVSGLPVGDYTFVSASPAGVAAFGVTVMHHSQGAALDREPRSKIRPVSSIRLVQDGGEGQGGGDQNVNIDSSNPSNVASQNMLGNGGGGPGGAGGGAGGAGGAGGGGAGGGGAGGGGAGGGGAGGGGAGGALLGAGAAAGAIGGGVLASQNSNSTSSGSSGGGTGPIASTGTTH